jgi:hypothetical protein
VGTQVAAYFKDNSSNKKADRWKLFCGRVTKYGPPSSDGDPPLYHIVWEDGDEEDYTDRELEKAKKLFKEKGTPPPPPVSNSSSPEKKAGGGALRSTSRRSRGDIASIVSNSESSTVQPHKKRKTESSSSPSVAAASSPVLKKKKKSSSVVVETEIEEADPSAVSSDEEPQWTTVHDIVGKRVVAYFAVDEGSSSVPFGGQVTRYSPPSRPGKTDQLYHIVWDDGVRDE